MKLTLLYCQKYITKREAGAEEFWRWNSDGSFTIQDGESIPASVLDTNCNNSQWRPCSWHFYSGKIICKFLNFWFSVNDRNRSIWSAAEDLVLSLIRSGSAWNPQLLILAQLAESGRWFRWARSDSSPGSFEVSAPTNNQSHIGHSGGGCSDIYCLPPKPAKAKKWG